MSKKSYVRVLTVILLIFTVCPSHFAYTHSGGTDANGGHWNRKTDEYHYHNKAKSQPQGNITPPGLEGLKETTSGAGRTTRRSEFRLTFWNIRRLSDKSRNDNELNKIARTLIKYDLIAVSEVHDEKVLTRIQNKLSELGSEYNYLISDPIGRAGSSYKERYAFLYHKERVSVVKGGEFYPDAADGTDNFVRDPYWATFRAGKFDFSVIVIHVVWGDRVAERRAEIMELPKVYKHVQEANGAEDDVILVGDFNRNPDDTAAYSNLMALPSMTQLFHLPQKSHIGDSSLYDNIFFQQNHVTEYLGSSGIDKFDETDFANNDQAANLEVSDHRPVWAAFRIDGLDPPSQPITRSTIGGVQGQPVLVGGSPIVDETPQEVTVYVTRTGVKYHLSSCSSLRYSKEPISLAKAKQQYGACSRCNPPR